MEKFTLLPVQVERRRAQYVGREPYILSNSDYLIHFLFDEEWEQKTNKTARFVLSDGKYIDTLFTGNECPVPIIHDSYGLRVGVYAGNMQTTTQALIPTKVSAVSGGGMPADPAPDVYAQIMVLLNEALARIEALEQGGVVLPDNETSAVLGVAVLDKMVLA